MKILGGAGYDLVRIKDVQQSIVNGKQEGNNCGRREDDAELGGNSDLSGLRAGTVLVRVAANDSLKILNVKRANPARVNHNVAARQHCLSASISMN